MNTMPATIFIFKHTATLTVAGFRAPRAFVAIVRRWASDRVRRAREAIAADRRRPDGRAAFTMLIRSETDIWALFASTMHDTPAFLPKHQPSVNFSAAGRTSGVRPKRQALQGSATTLLWWSANPTNSLSPVP